MGGTGVGEEETGSTKNRLLAEAKVRADTLVFSLNNWYHLLRCRDSGAHFLGNNSGLVFDFVHV